MGTNDGCIDNVGLDDLDGALLCAATAGLFVGERVMTLSGQLESQTLFGLQNAIVLPHNPAWLRHIPSRGHFDPEHGVPLPSDVGAGVGNNCGCGCCCCCPSSDDGNSPTTTSSSGTNPASNEYSSSPTPYSLHTVRPFSGCTLLLTSSLIAISPPLLFQVVPNL